MIDTSYFLKAECVEDQRNGQRGDGKSRASAIEIDAALAAGDLALLELLAAQLSDVASLAAITSRGITRSDLTVKSDIHSLDFSGMNASGVITAGSWSSPRVDNLPADLNTHRVTGFDCIDILPTDSDFLERIGDANTFVKDFYLWMYEEQVSARENESSPRERNQVGFDTSRHEGFNHECDHNDARHRHGEPDGSWSIEHEIAHLGSHIGIFSQLSGLEGSHA